MTHLQKRKILHITTANMIASAENMLLSLLAHADRNRFEFVVACLFDNGHLGERVKSLGVRYYNLRFKSFYLFPWRLFQLIRQERIDVVQVYGITADIVVRPFAKLFGVKVVISSIRSGSGPPKWYRRCMARFASSQVDLWISNSVAGKNGKEKPKYRRPTRILRIIARLNIGGPAIQAVRLSAELNARHFRTLLTVGVVGKNEGDMSTFADYWGVEPIVIPELGREIHWWDDLIVLRKLIKIIRNYKPDIVHTHTAKAGTLGRITAILTRVPICVHTFHGHVFDGYFSHRTTQLFLAIERLLAHFTDRIITVSPSQKRDLSEKFRLAPPQRFSVVPLGLDLGGLLELSTNEDKSPTAFNLSPNHLVITIVGRLVPIKNHQLFLKSAHLLVQKCNAKIQFLVVGDGELRNTLELQADKLDLSRFIHFIGWQSDMVKVYRATDVVVLTSLNEGTPVSIIEAMAAAKPVVATDVGGVGDIVSDGITGFIVPSNDANALAEKTLILLKSKKLRRQFGLMARKQVASRFVTERLVRDMVRLYRELETPQK